MNDKELNKMTKEELLDLLIKIKSENNVLKKKVMIYEKASNYDFMTNLLNRRGMRQALSDLGGRNAIICMIDIDNFKDVNDYYGHPVGDKAIIFVGNFLKKYFDNNGIICRFGGDEFLLWDLDASPKETFDKFSMLRADLKETSLVEFGFQLTLSIGLKPAIINENNLANINLCDKALYASKLLGRDTITVYSDEIDKVIGEFMDHGITKKKIK